MTREELLSLIRTAIDDPSAFTPRIPTDHAPARWALPPEWCARAVLAALRSPDDEPHIITVWEDGETWSLAHPLQCRFDDDATCPVYVAARWLDGPPAKPGRYGVTTDDDGELKIGEAVT